VTINQAYITFLQLANRNLTNDNISVDKPRFVLLFNRIQNAFVEWLLEKSNQDDVRDIQKLLVLDKTLIKNRTVDNHVDFKLPEDYFNFSNLKIYASKDNCKDIKISSFEIKNQDVEELLSDEFNKPSFEFRETFYTVSSDNISIYLDDFTIDKSKLSYYRYPQQINMSGYIDIEGNASVDIDPEFDDKVVNKILLACSKDYASNNSDSAKYQLDKDRLFNEL